MPAFKQLLDDARQNNAEAQAELGLRYLHGWEVERNEFIAQYWVEKSANAGNPFGQYLLGSMHEKGYGNFKKNMTEANNCYKKVLTQKNTPNPTVGLRFSLANMYLEGLGGLKKNPSAARKFFESAANEGYAPAQSKFSYMLFFGIGMLFKHPYKGKKLSKLAYVQKYPSAASNLAYAYTLGKGGPRNYKKAWECAEYAYQQHDPMGTNNLAWLYKTGKGVKKNLQQAARFFVLAASQDLDLAKKNLDSLPSNTQTKLGANEGKAEFKDLNQKMINDYKKFIDAERKANVMDQGRDMLRQAIVNGPVPDDASAAGVGPQEFYMVLGENVIRTGAKAPAPVQQGKPHAPPQRSTSNQYA
jgi:TPR repeat protein